MPTSKSSHRQGLTETARHPRFTDRFVQQPILVLVLSALLLIAGLRAANELPVLQYPRIESSALEISTMYIGASAETVQGFITDPVERAAASVPGVDYIDSDTTAGMSRVTLYLKLNEDSTDALAELSSRLSQIRFELPTGAEDPSVRVLRADRQQAGWYLDVPLDQGLSRAEVTDFLQRNVNPQLASIPGVQQVDFSGGRFPAMRIWLDPERMAILDISAQDVEAALAGNNIIATVGNSENGEQRINLRLDTSLKNEGDFESMIVADRNGALVRLRDIARIELGEVEANDTARISQKKALYIAVWPQPGANEIEIGNALYEVIDEINPTLPEGIEISIGFDVTLYMRNALREIFITLAETILLVGIVVVLFMGSVRTALVPLVAIPISLLGTIATMTLLGFSLNLLTVLAIVLSVGLVVDDAIVVVENVARYMRDGMSRTQAALASSRQLLSPIVAMTLTLAAVYAPIGFLSGLTGVLFKEFAFTLAMAVVFSGLVALTLSPVMSAWVCAEGGKEGPMTRGVNSLFNATQALYTRLLDALLRNNGKVIFVAVFITLLMIPFLMFSLRELAPTEDQSSINVAITAPPEASLDYTEAHMREVVAAMQTLPGNTIMWQVLRPSGGFSGMEFQQFHDRPESVHEMYPKAFRALSGISGLRTFPILPSALPTSGDFDVEMVVLSTDEYPEMLGYAFALLDAAMSSGQFMFADTDLRIDLTEAEFRIDREKVADLGLDLADVSRQLSVFLSANYVNRFNLDGRAYRVIPMVERHGRSDPDALLDLKIRNASGDLIPLRAIASLTESATPRTLGKFQQSRAFRIQGGMIPGNTKEQGLAVLEAAAAEILPANYRIDYAGESRQLRSEGSTLFGVLAISLAIVFFALAIQFNSLKDPLVILLGSVPLALSGAMLFTFLGFTTINIYSQIGFITLVGLIAKNAILIVEFARQMQLDGASKLEAIRAAAQTRLRPVLMTTGATVMGHFPLVLVSGAGAEARNSIGIILVAGMLVGTLFTLFILPSIYYLLGTTHSHPSESNTEDNPELEVRTARVAA